MAFLLCIHGTELQGPGKGTGKWRLSVTLCLFSRRGMASKAPQGMQVTQAHLEPRVFQEKWAPQDWAYQAQRASVDSLEMSGYLDHQASPVLLAPQEPQDSQVRGSPPFAF